MFPAEGDQRIAEILCQRSDARRGGIADHRRLTPEHRITQQSYAFHRHLLTLPSRWLFPVVKFVKDILNVPPTLASM